MSLKNILQDKIQQSGYLSIEEVYQICEDNHYKASNAERRLRRSESPNVEAVFDDKRKYIKGYRWLEREISRVQIEVHPEPNRLFELRSVTSL